MGRSPCLDHQVLWNLPCMRQLSELAHEYTAMGVLGPIQLIGRRRDEYPLVQDTVNDPQVQLPPALLHCPSSHVAACGSSLVVCLKRISAGVLSILQSRPQTIFDKPPCAIFPFLHGTCFFFVGVCVFNSCYWAVIVSFRPPFANRAIHFHLVAIATFW